MKQTGIIRDAYKKKKRRRARKSKKKKVPLDVE